MKIYVVIGATGEYSDKSEWPVCWRSTLAEAELVVQVCNREAAEYKRWDDAHYGAVEWDEKQAKLAKMFDPYFVCDYTGTTYHVWTIEEDPHEGRERKPSFRPSEECPFDDEDVRDPEDIGWCQWCQSPISFCQC